MTRISSFAMASLTVLFMFLILSSSVNGTVINVQNKCGQVLTACDAAGGEPPGGPGAPGFRDTFCYVLGAFGGAVQRDFGSQWTAGLIWGLPGTNTDPGQGNQAKTVANKMEMTINKKGQDSYDLSNVDGYNLPLLVNPTSNVNRSGTHCGTPICQIPNLNQVCGPPNFFSGFPAFGCKNVDGGGTKPTPGTQFFKNPCMSSYSFSSDNVVFGCETGTNYEVVFCP